MSKAILIRQPAGLGDIFFCQKIAKELVKHNYRVIWPVIPQFSYLATYLKFEGIEYPTTDSQFEFKNYYIKPPSQFIPVEQYSDISILNLQTSSWYFPFEGSVMFSKYKVVGLDFNDWKEYFNFQRNKEREEKLWNHFKLNEREKFIFINKNYASPPNIEVNPRVCFSSALRNIEMTFIENVNIFDWCKIIEGSEEIYTVDTSLNYLIEVLLIKATTLNMFLRNDRTDFSAIKGIFKRNWNYLK